MSTPLYRDPDASVEERVEDLLALMTLDEKLAQAQSWRFWEAPHNRRNDGSVTNW